MRLAPDVVHEDRVEIRNSLSGRDNRQRERERERESNRVSRRVAATFGAAGLVARACVKEREREH